MVTENSISHVACSITLRLTTTACSTPSGGSTMATLTHSHSHNQPPPNHPRLRLRNISPNLSRRQSSIRSIRHPSLSRRLRRSNRLLRLLPPRTQLRPLPPRPRAQFRAVCRLPRVTVFPLPVPPRVRSRHSMPLRRGRPGRTTSKTWAPPSSNLACLSPRLVDVSSEIEVFFHL